MEMTTLVLPVAGGLIAVVGGFLLLRAERHARRPAPPEAGLTPSYAEQAGGRFDGVNWTVPFVRVAAYPDFVSISCVTNQIVLRKGEVTGIDRERLLMATGLRIRHTRADLPGTVILWPRDAERLDAALRASLL